MATNGQTEEFAAKHRARDHRQQVGNATDAKRRAR